MSDDEEEYEYEYDDDDMDEEGKYCPTETHQRSWTMAHSRVLNLFSS